MPEHKELLDKVILGIQDSHDAAAALVQNGKILCAISEERIQRIKSAGGFPQGAIDACLRFAGLTPSDIDYVALAGTRAVPVNMLASTSTFSIKDFLTIQEKVRQPRIKEGKSVSIASVFPDYRPKGEVYYDLDRVPLKESWELTKGERRELSDYRISFISQRLGITREKIIPVDHHTCHAYYGYYASSAREEPVLALTMDAGGDGLYDSVNVFDQEGKFTCLHSSHESIIGPLYTYVTLALGMRPFEHEYKVMGLAPYARGVPRKEVYEFFRTFLALDGVAFHKNADIPDLYWHTLEKLRHARFDSIAGGLQDFCEEFLTNWVSNAINRAQIGKVTFSGGVSLNVKANLLISELPQLERLHIPPGAGDESLPVGAAWAVMDHLCPGGEHRRFIEPLSSAYLGPDISEHDINNFRAHPIVREQFTQSEGNPDDLASTALAEGNIVAVCRNRMEFGPRSLGHRSLIADASRPGTVRKINESIKNRDFWMPFAPSILSERFGDYCHPGKSDHHYMTVAAPSTKMARNDLGAALHPYDLTARPQEVTSSACPDYHALIRSFEEKTGLGGVLNTSLNIHGKPIVMNPVEIADELLSVPDVNLSHLIVGNNFFTRRSGKTGTNS